MIDIDSNAIKRAKNRSLKLNFLKNINFQYINSNILEQNIDQILINNNLNIKYDLIVFNAAIEHFKPEEVSQIFTSCKKIMQTNGLVFGYTLVEEEDHVFDHHELLFNTKEDLKDLVKKDFENVSCFESLSETRHNLYFLAKN